MLLQTYGIGDAASLQAQWDQWYQTIKGLNQSLVIAKQTNNPAMMEQVRGAITWVMQRMNSLNQQIKGQEMPSEVLASMDRTVDAALKVATDVGGVALGLIKDVGAISRGAARAVNWLPFLVVGALGVLALGFGKGGLKVGLRL